MKSCQWILSYSCSLLFVRYALFIISFPQMLLSIWEGFLCEEQNNNLNSRQIDEGHGWWGRGVGVAWEVKRGWSMFNRETRSLIRYHSTSLSLEQITSSLSKRSFWRHLFLTLHVLLRTFVTMIFQSFFFIKFTGKEQFLLFDHLKSYIIRMIYEVK